MMQYQKNVRITQDLFNRRFIIYNSKPGQKGW